VRRRIGPIDRGDASRADRPRRRPSSLDAAQRDAATDVLLAIRSAAMCPAHPERPSPPPAATSPAGEPAVGCRALCVRDPEQGAELPVWALYPPHAPADARQFGPYSLDVAVDAPVAGRALPVVVISHGNNGSPWTHRGTAAHLARRGFIVVLPEHVGNSRSDGSLAGTVAMLAHRPRQLRRAVDAVLADPLVGGHADATRLGLIGHSVGAYTALAAAGGRPVTTVFDTPVGPARPVPVPVTPHADVRALVLLAPAAGWYMAPGALAAVEAPVLLYSGTEDAVAPAFHADIVVHGVRHPDRVRHVVVPGAGHHSFQTPFPPAMAHPGFPPSQDPAGFDRARFHERLNREIEEFLRATL
jgi:predicted dienelactone hydrolase